MKTEKARRLARLEAAAIPPERHRYVVRFKDDRDAPEVRAQLAEAARRRGRVALLPEKCASAAEWVATYGPHGTRSAHG